MVASRIASSEQAAVLASPKAKSSLVRRLVAAKDDPAKQRIRAWLASLEDEQLTGLGLTPQDIVILRGAQERQYPAASRQASPRLLRAGQIRPGHRKPFRESARPRSGQLQKL
jgi:hypothetical protein